MRPFLPLLVAALFVVVTVVPVAGFTSPPDQTDAAVRDIETVANTTNYLAISDSEMRQSTHASPGVDIGTVVESGSSQLHRRHETGSFERQFQSAESDTRRTQLIRSYVSTIERRQARLDSRQATAMERYASGDITAAEFLRVRILNNAEATELLSTLETVRRVASTTPGYSTSTSMSTRIRTVEGNLRTLSGPVSDQLQSQVTGGETEAVYLEGSETGYMLGTIGDQYIRETRLDDERDPTRPDQFQQAAENDSTTDRFTEADERASELYTWLYQRQRPSFTFYGTSGIYELSASHSNGRLTAYLDAGTRNVFYEEQQLELADVTTTATQTTVNGTVQITIQQSFETGPMLVSASDTDTGDSLDGTVTIDDTRVGSTGRDGSLWTIEPSGSYTVTVSTAEGQATVTVPAF